MKIFLSVIVPVYNGEKYIKRCINSIQNQTYKNLEIIVVNDGSIDNTLNIIEELAKEDERVKIFSTENQGVSSARNFGMKKAIGEYISFVDSDDFIYSNHFEKMMKHKEYDLIMGNGYFELENNQIVKENVRTGEGSISSDEAIKKIFSEDIYGTVWRAVFKKKIIEKNNLQFRKLKISEDMIFLFEYMLKISEIYYVERAGYVYNRANSLNVVNNMGDNKYLEDYISFPKLLNEIFKTAYKYEVFKNQIAKKTVEIAMQIRLMIPYREFVKTLKENKLNELDNTIKLNNKKYKIYYWGLIHKQYWICNMGYYFNKIKTVVYNKIHS